MKRNCHIKGLALIQFSHGTDFTLPGSTEDRYTYAYSYDSFGRLTSSERFEGTSGSATNAFSEKNLSFDGNGNILTLTRYGNGNSTIRDSLIYSYSGNRIEKLHGAYNGQAITHTVQNNPVPGTADYIYDGNGNMTLDALRNITLTYDINNLVSTVSRNDTLLSTYYYLADGTKYKVVDKDNKGRAYIGPFSYALEKIGNTVYSYLEGIDTDGGRIMVLRKQNGNQTTADYTTAFFVKDHLGSTRVMLNALGDILERNAYYPFGLQMNQGKAYPTLTERLQQLYTGYISPTPARRDLYNGKEIQTAAGTYYLDYGFRQYDPVTARWMAVDQKAEKYLTITPFNYAINSPIVVMDRKGKDPVTGIIDALVAFSVSVGVDIAESMFFEDKSFEEATESINWKSAAASAGISYLESILITGTGSVLTLAKIGKSRVGRFVIKLSLNTLNIALDKYYRGEYDDEEGHFSFEAFQEGLKNLLFDVAISTLIDMGYEKKAKKIEGNLSRSYKNVQKEERKVTEKINKGADQEVLKKRYKKRDDAQLELIKSFEERAFFIWDKEALKKSILEILEEENNE